MKQKCLICKKTAMEQKHWINCPKIKGLICMSHCFNECKYRKEDYCSYKGNGI